MRKVGETGRAVRHNGRRPAPQFRMRMRFVSPSAEMSLLRIGLQSIRRRLLTLWSFRFPDNRFPHPGANGDLGRPPTVRIAAEAKAYRILRLCETLVTLVVRAGNSGRRLATTFRIQAFVGSAGGTAPAVSERYHRRFWQRSSAVCAERLRIYPRPDGKWPGHSLSLTIRPSRMAMRRSDIAARSLSCVTITNV